MSIPISMADELLTTTRSVRKGLDFTRPVEPAVIKRCIEIATQAPTGGNAQGWHFIVITDADKRASIATLYKQSFDIYVGARREQAAATDSADPHVAQTARVLQSAIYLSEHMGEAPMLIIPTIEGRVEHSGPMAQAGLYGSILPAAWSLMLALRARGIGSAWTTLHLRYEKEAAALLGIPDTITQAALLPVAYLKNTNLKPAKRLPAAERTYWNEWGNRQKPEA